MVHQVLIAGFGGQGVLTCGQILALAATREGKKVTWMPSYGPEQRGGTASCVITLSDRPIGSPLAEKISAALVFNEPSLVKFEPHFGERTLLILNSCMVRKDVKQFTCPVHQIPADDIARETGLRRTGNIVMLGAYIAVSRTVSLGAAQEAIGNYLGPSKQHLLETNQKALSAGWRFLDGGERQGMIHHDQ